MSTYDPKVKNLIDVELSNLYTDISTMSGQMYDALHQRKQMNHVLFMEKYKNVKILHDKIAEKMQNIKILASNLDRPLDD